MSNRKTDWFSRAACGPRLQASLGRATLTIVAVWVFSASGWSAEQGSKGSPAVKAKAVSIVSASLVDHAENPAGLQIGFWANYDRSGDLVRDFGPRPIERVNFHKWAQHEKSSGVYNFKKAFLWEQRAHLAGSTVITNVNTFFTRRLNADGMDSIPAHYTPDITDPDTRAAARKYLAAFTRRLLEDVGTAWLVLDYEMLWFAKPIKPEIREAYRDWYVEAAEICRDTAQEMGLADQLKIGVVVNTDPFDTAGHSVGWPARPRHQPQEWLLDCVRTADFFGIDTYAGGATQIKTPEHQLRTIRFWIEHYALDRPVYVTESGFSTCHESDDKSRGYHIRGTEAEQASFFKTMFESLAESRENPDELLSRLRGYCIWMYADHKTIRDPLEKHFGLVRVDGTPKPAHAVVAKATAFIEANSEFSPTQDAGSVDILDDIKSEEPINIDRHSGVEFKSIQFQIVTPDDAGKQLSLVVKTVDPVCLIAHVKGVGWVTTHPKEKTTSVLELPTLPVSSRVDIELMFTSARYPLQTQLTRLRVLSR